MTGPAPLLSFLPAWHDGEPARQLDTETTLAAIHDGRLDTLSANHSPEFAPVVEPTLSTGIQALVVAARAWLEPAPDGP